MTSTILELRQTADNTHLYTNENGEIRNGDFKVRLKKPLILENDDTIRLNQIFLQTQEKDQDEISIDFDIDLRLDFIRYINDCLPSNSNFLTRETQNPRVMYCYNSFDAYGYGRDGTQLPNPNIRNYLSQGQPYMESLTLSPPKLITNASKVITNFIFKKIKNNIPTQRTTLFIQYKDQLFTLNNPYGFQPIITRNIPALTKDNDTEITIEGNFVVYQGKTNITIKNLKELQANNLELVSINEGVAQPTNNPSVVPKRVSNTIRIPKGKYKATDIATLITNGYTNTKIQDDDLGFSNTLSLLKNLETDRSTQQLIDSADNTRTIEWRGVSPTELEGFYQVAPFNNRDEYKVFIKGNPTTEAPSQAYSDRRMLIFGVPNPYQFGATGVQAEGNAQNDPLIICGSDSFGLEYDTDTNKFKLSKIHTSILDTNSRVSALFIKQNNNPNILDSGHSQLAPNTPPNTNSFLATSFSGIFISSWSATYAEPFKENKIGDFYNFVEDILGFDVADLCLNIDETPISSNVMRKNGVYSATNDPRSLFASGTTADGQPYNFYPVAEALNGFSFNSVIGKDRTDDKSSIDGLRYTTGFRQGTPIHSSSNVESDGLNYFNLIRVGGSNVDVYVNTTLRSELVAQNILKQNLIDFGYYLIEIKMLVDTDYFSSSDIKHKIFSVINRYYQQGGYLSGTNSGVQYFHQGEPIIISEIGVRILDNDGNVATNLDVDNSVFLEVIKGQAS